ncbi:MAG TPA: DUF1566 domain-containing protein [Candidatus Omnitrophota bacterium]|nr:DUF1566 domain-containing protein [Candidatus Omnitrophota bacterium]
MKTGVLSAIFLLSALPAWAGDRSYPIVDTSQNTCFDDRGRAACPSAGAPFHGQDGQVAGTRPSYRDNGDGTVTDLVTGLMWQKDFSRTSWTDAPNLAAAARTGGHSDWRVPTIKELYSLMDFSGATGTMRGGFGGGAPSDARPYLDTSVFAFEYPRQGRFIDAQYVSATDYRGIVMGRDRAFFGVNFADGRIKGYPQNGGPGGRLWYARLVRGNPDYGRNDFADNRDGTVTDRATGLTWMQADSGKGMNWQQALAFCEGLDLAGHSDWRLPNAKELHSIVDYSRSPDATASAAIDPVFQITAISERDGSRNWPYFWTSTSHQDGPRPGDFGVYFAFGKAMGNIGQGGGMGGPMMGGPPGMGRPPGPPGMGMQQQAGPLTLLDVHGAGAQRSSPKSGDEASLPVGHGPQGDVLRIYNFARCVRGG